MTKQTPTDLRTLALALLLVGCSDDAPTYYADVKPILDARCVSCHADGEIAPFSADTYESAHTYRGIIANAAVNERMPPWYAQPGNQTYRNDPSLTADQILTLVEWANAGGPEGDPLETGTPLDSTAEALQSVDAELTLPEAYTPPNEEDNYRCFVLDWDEPQTAYVTGFDAEPGVLGLVHHMAAFLYRPDTLYGEEIFNILQGWDDAHEGPGYPCYGGPSGGDDVDLPIQQLAQWVPGMGAIRLPEGVGIEVPAGSKVVLQIHYNTSTTSPAPDQSSILFETTAEVEKRAAFAPWLDATWPLGTMTIPANNASVSHSAKGSPYGLFGFLLPEMDFTNGFDIHSILVHMHQLGKAANVTIHRENGEEEVLLELSNYDFDWQLVYHLEQPIAFGVNDELSLKCTWDNSEANVENGEPVDVNWGEGSGDEMCVANILISER